MVQESAGDNLAGGREAVRDVAAGVSDRGFTIGVLKRDFAVVDLGGILGGEDVDSESLARFQNTVRVVCEREGVEVAIDSWSKTTSQIPFVIYRKPQFDITDKGRAEYQSIQAAGKAAAR